MSVDLTGLPIAEAHIEPFRLGGLMRSPLGAAQRILRMGSRWSIRVTTPPMPIEPNGRYWAATLTMALDEGAVVRVRQPNRRSGMPATATVAANVNTGRTVPLNGLPPGYTLLRGDFISFIVGGVRYLDQIRSDYTALPDGTATVVIANLIRAPLASGTVVEIADPKIEGSIEGDFGGVWGRNRLTSFDFTVTEDD